MSHACELCYDSETGEVVTCSVNQETGESSYDGAVSTRSAINVVRIPKMKPIVKKPIKFPDGYVCQSKRFKSLKANILAGSNIVSHRMLLIPPAVMIFPGLVCVFLVILEIYLHVRCHKKSKGLKDPNLYYRSPLHAVTSIFCGVCRDTDSAVKIGQLQDQRRHRYDYLRGIAL